MTALPRPDRPDGWTIVVPLKSASRGKSRIEMDPAVRRALVLAMAMDTASAVASARSVAGVLVVVEDVRDADQLSCLPGVRVHLTATDDLNAAIVDGLVGLGRGFDGRVAVLPADLPSLAAGELDSALAVAGNHLRAVVADGHGTGTTLLTARSPALLRPRYGPGSLGRHVAAGAAVLPVPSDSGLRRDVDHVVDLAGVTGRRTVAVLEDARWSRAPVAPRVC